MEHHDEILHRIIRLERRMTKLEDNLVALTAAVSRLSTGVSVLIANSDTSKAADAVAAATASIVAINATIDTATTPATPAA